MSYGFFSNNGLASLIISDSFNPYYYRGVSSKTEQTAPGSFYQQFGLLGQQLTGILDDQVKLSFFNITASGYFIIPRFSDTDLIFVEPLSQMVGIGISKIEPVSYGGLAWKIEVAINWDKTLYNPTQYDLMTSTFSSAVVPLLPKFHIFSQFTDAMAPKGRFGMAVYDSYGASKYNSSMKPLRLKQILNVDYPASPTDGSSVDRHPVNRNSYGHPYCTRPIYCIPHVSQAVAEKRWVDEVNKYGWLISASASVDYTFWGAYGGALLGGGKMQVATAWAMQAFGYFGSSSRSGSAIFGLIPTGSNTQGVGAPPFNHSNANGAQLPLLVADANDYI